jgi:SNF2 family DNA or RNA helicase
MIRVDRDADLSSKHEAFDFQRAAVDKIARLPFGAIFHEQGLGKTKMALDLALRWISSGEIDSVIIVTKKHLIENWRDETLTHTYVHPRILSQDRAANFRAVNSPARIYLTHFEVLASERSRFALFLRTRRVAIILDEAQKIKNPDSRVTQALFSLREGFVRRVVLTGTPIPNRPFDIWALIYFLDGGSALGTDFKAFKDSVDLDSTVDHDHKRRRDFEDALESIWQSIEPFSTRETKISSGLDLPPKLERRILVNLEHRQRELYDRTKDELRSVIVRNGMAQLDQAEDLLKRLLRLVQYACNPAIVDESYENVPGKFGVLENEVHAAIDRGEKIIIWTGFIRSVDWLARELQPFGVAKHHGEMTTAERSAAIWSFKNESTIRVLVATPASAKEGLTLTVANNAVFFDRSFSLDDYLQAQDRIHRISQTKPCTIINLVGRGTIDEWIDALVNAKRLAAALAQGDISREAFADEMSYSFDEILRRVLS